LWRGLVALKRTKGGEQLTVAVIFAAWIAYQAQSIISIDNIGIAIWGYVLGGAVVGLSILVPRESVGAKKETIPQPVVSGFLFLFSLAISALFLGSESSMHSLNKLPPPHSQNELETYLQANQKPLNYLLKEPSFELINARNVAQVGKIPEAIMKLKALITSDPLNFSAIDLLAQICEYQKNWIGAVELRKTVKVIDPFNQINLLSLGEDYKNTGDTASAKAILSEINTFAAHTPEAIQAAKDLG
jgi:tetratricopeptide (TPR) repeat protein